MVRGLWTVEFRSSIGLLGFGTVIFDDNGRVYGGDGGYYYKGMYEINGEEISGALKVQKYNPGYNSVFGPIETFNLSASGTAGDSVMVLLASVMELPGTRMSIVCTRREDL
jgi:hypothetical protein